MPALRTTGSFRRFFVEGDPLDLEDPGLYRAIEEHSFRSIQDSTSERESIGWVSPWDPSGRSFDAEEIRLGERLALTLRVDRKRIPATLLRIRCAAEERGELLNSGKPKLSRTRKIEIRQSIEDELLSRALPNVALHAVYIDSRTRTVLFFGTADRVCCYLAELFLRTFDRQLVEVTPGVLAEALERDPERRDYIDRSGPLLLMPTLRRLVSYADGDGTGASGEGAPWDEEREPPDEEELASDFELIPKSPPVPSDTHPFHHNRAAGDDA